ncbi:MAG: hypothetical protein P8Z37_18525 [Acidobacteriota bacterium]
MIAIRIKFLISFLLAMSLLVPSKSADANSDSLRTYIQSKLKVYFVANPNARRAKNQLEISEDASDDRKVFGDTVHNNEVFENFLKMIFNDVAHGGDTAFQYGISQILSIRDKTMAMFLYNDVQPFNAFAKRSFVNCVDDSSYVWPCASNTSEGEWGYFGKIHLGRHFLSNNTDKELKYTLLQELGHTQDMSDFPIHGFYVGSKYYNYGADAMHFFEEAVPAMGSAFKEGIANALAYKYIMSGNSTRLEDWYDPDKRIGVEINAPKYYSWLEKDLFLYKQLNDANITPIDTSGGYAYYKLSQLPPKIRIHNEMIVASIFYAYMKHVSESRVIHSLKLFQSGQVFSREGSMTLMLASMCRINLPTSQARTTAAVLASSDKGVNIIPLAFTDYFTGFSAQSKNDFNGLFTRNLMRKQIEYYWKYRDDIINSCRTAKDWPEAARLIAREAKAIMIEDMLNSR